MSQVYALDKAPLPPAGQPNPNALPPISKAPDVMGKTGQNPDGTFNSGPNYQPDPGYQPVNPVPATNYAQAFDPNHDMVSVNTGNASVTQLENLSAIASTVPEMPTDFSPVFLGIGALIFTIL